MAYTRVTDYIDIGTGAYKDAVSYHIAKDPEFKQIIAESLHDTKNLDVWHTPLKKLPEDGEGYYKDEDVLYARVKVHIGTHESPWFTLEPGNQNIQEVVITEEGKDPIDTTSDIIGLQ